MKTVETTRFGAIDVPEESLCSFPTGIPGFDALKSWCLVHLEEQKNVWWLQSTDDSDIALMIVDPDDYFEGYEVHIDADELRVLGIDEDANGLPPLEMRVILSVDSVNGGLTANLRAPLIFNAETRQGAQFVLQGSGYSLRHPLGPPRDQIPDMPSLAAAVREA